MLPDSFNSKYMFNWIQGGLNPCILYLLLFGMERETIGSVVFLLLRWYTHLFLFSSFVHKFVLLFFFCFVLSYLFYNNVIYCTVHFLKISFICTSKVYLGLKISSQIGLVLCRRNPVTLSSHQSSCR